MAERDSEQGGRGFRVTDRRRFSESGETRAEAEPETSPSPEAVPSPPPPTAGAAVSPSPGTGTPEVVTFSTFVLGLSTQALLHLGEIPDPETRTTARDLVAAKQVIDILGILRDKSRNNLEPGEQSMLDSILYDLRMRYVELVRPGVA